MGYKARGGIDKDQTDHDDDCVQSFPHFTSSFSVGGVSYPFTMVGHQPASGWTWQAAAQGESRGAPS